MNFALPSIVLALGASAVAADVTIYDDDPAHPWNRVYAHFYARADQDGHTHHEHLEPALWPGTRAPLRDPVYPTIMNSLDDFIDSNAADSITESRRRALFQRDMWAVFDWASRLVDEDGVGERAHALCARLAKIVASVALTADQIAALPDTYHLGVVFDGHPDLIPRLMDPTGEWVRVNRNEGVPIAPTHTAAAGGRSMFSVLLSVPGGQATTRDYLATLDAAIDPIEIEDDIARLRRGLPQFPDSTRVALVQQIILLDVDLRPVPTSIVERVQLRKYRDVAGAQTPEGFQDVQHVEELDMRRRARFFEGGSGLDGFPTRDDETIIRFGTHGTDPIEHGHDPLGFPPARCHACHGQPGVYSLASISRIMAPIGQEQRVIMRLPVPDGDRTLDFGAGWTDEAGDRRAAIEWLEASDGLALLRELATN